MVSVKWDENFPHERAIPHDWDGIFFDDFTYIGVELNINKLRRILKVVIPCIITTNTTCKSFEAFCFCANLVPVRRGENNRINAERIRPTQASSLASRAHEQALRRTAKVGPEGV